LNKPQRKSLAVFGAGLALQCVILFSTVPGTAQQIEPGQPSLCFTNCPSVSVDTIANVSVSRVYTSTITVNTSPNINVNNNITQTVLVGELSGAAAEFLRVEASRGQIDIIQPMTYVWSLDLGGAAADPIPPIVMTDTIQANAPGVHTQSLGPYTQPITITTIPEVEASTLVTDSPLPFTLRYKFSPLASVGVLTETYFIAPGSNAITETLVAGRIDSLDGRYRSVVGSGLGPCDTTELSFDCTVLYDKGLRGAVITATIEAREPGQLLHSLQVSGGGASLPLSLESSTHPIQVGMAIKPWEDPNTIRIGKPHNIPVAILSSPGFNAVDVDVETLTFGPTGHEASPTSCAPEYSNADQVIDLVCHFDGMDAGFQLGDKLGKLSGRTLPSASFASGLPIAGQDSVRIIDPGQGHDHD
jgi:hypothetical protein